MREAAHGRSVRRPCNLCHGRASILMYLGFLAPMRNGNSLKKRFSRAGKVAHGRSALHGVSAQYLKNSARKGCWLS